MKAFDAFADYLDERPDVREQALRDAAFLRGESEDIDLFVMPHIGMVGGPMRDVDGSLMWLGLEELWACDSYRPLSARLILFGRNAEYTANEDHERMTRLLTTVNHGEPDEPVAGETLTLWLLYVKQRIVLPTTVLRDRRPNVRS